MSHNVCPFWLGYLLVCRFRRFGQNSDKMLAPYLRSGMTVLEGSRDGTYRGSAKRNFGKLAGYILGGNKKSEKITMTAPVHMELGTNGSSMSFVMPSKHSAGDLPQPNDSGVTLHSVSSEYVAVVRFGGFASDSVIQARRDGLATLLAEKGIRHKGKFRFLGYNPPFQWFGRRNKVIVGVDWKE